MVDAHVWGACGEICTGSSPVFDNFLESPWRDSILVIELFLWVSVNP